MELTNRLNNTLFAIDDLDYEIIYLNDGSRVETWQIVEEIVKEARNIKGVKFSRNFGEHNGIVAGLKKTIVNGLK